MSTREYAASLINTLSDEQLDDVLAFLMKFSAKKPSAENKNNEWENKRHSFEKIKQIRNDEWADSGKDYKEMYLEYLDERYGSL